MSKIYVDFSSLAAKNKSPGRFVRDPYGFDYALASSSSGSLSSEQSGVRGGDAAAQEVRARKAWEVALSPGKTLPMQAFMAWMSGTGVSIFSIIITGMILMTPVRAIMSLGKTFAPLAKGDGASVDLTMQKAAFVAINLAGILFGVYRLSIMGLLPTTSSDWLAFLPPKTYLEYSA